MTTAFIIAALIAGSLAIVAMVLLFGRLRALPPLTEAAPTSAPRISIVIPARNEEDNLKTLLPSITAQTLRPHEVIVVDDQSDDATAEVAAGNGACVVSSKDLPNGWFGKPWACQQGADTATGEVLLFLDADVELEPSALARLALSAAASPDAVISVCPWHRIENTYEELSVFFNLLMVAGIGAFTFRGNQASGIGLFGQTMWISKSCYGEVGGHESVKRTVLENFHLAGDLEKRGIERRCYVGHGSISMRMFPGGFDDLRSSWAKGSSSGADLTSSLAMGLSICWLIGLMALSMITMMLPLTSGDAVPVVLTVYLIVACALAILFRTIGRFSWWSALLFPIPLYFYQALFARAVARKRQGGTTQWKGRDVA